VKLEDVREYVSQRKGTPVTLPAEMYEWLRRYAEERCVYPTKTEMPEGVISVVLGGKVRHVTSEKP
jgi:hypothetical protein